MCYRLFAMKCFLSRHLCSNLRVFDSEKKQIKVDLQISAPLCCSYAIHTLGGVSEIRIVRIYFVKKGR